jgi:hypothetical protein
MFCRAIEFQVALTSRPLCALPPAAAAALPSGSGSDPPLGLLVGKLLGALAASEKFVVQLNPITAPPSAASMYGGGGYYRGGYSARK